MTAHTRMSAKGQVVIPKEVRDRLGLSEGTFLDVLERGNEVVLKVPCSTPKLSVEEAQRRIRKIFTYRGPRISDEEIASVGPRMAAERYRRLDK